MHDVNGVAADPQELEKATALLRGGRFKAALDVLEPLQDLYPLDANVWRLTGLTRGSADDLDGAVKALQRAVDIRPDVAQNHYNLAVALKARGDIVLARRSVDRALVIEPTYSQARKLSDTLPAGRKSSPPTVVAAPPDAGAGGAAAGPYDPIGGAARPLPVASAASAPVRVPPAPASAPPPTAARPTDTTTIRHSVNERDIIRERQIEAQIEADRIKEEMRLFEIQEYERSRGQWCWDGFLWGLGAPYKWLFWHCSWLAAVVAFFAIRLVVFIAAASGPKALIVCALLQVGFAIYLGMRGNCMSWDRRSFSNVQDFRNCHRMWLVSGLVVPIFLGYLTFRLDASVIRSRMGPTTAADMTTPPPLPPPATPEPPL